MAATSQTIKSLYSTNDAEWRLCVSKLTIMVQIMACRLVGAKANIWTKAWILLIGLLGTNFSEILIEMYTFPFKKMHLKMSSGECCPSWTRCINELSWEVRDRQVFIGLYGRWPFSPFTYQFSFVWCSLTDDISIFKEKYLFSIYYFRNLLEDGALFILHAILSEHYEGVFILPSKSFRESIITPWNSEYRKTINELFVGFHQNI